MRSVSATSANWVTNILSSHVPFPTSGNEWQIDRLAGMAGSLTMCRHRLWGRAVGLNLSVVLRTQLTFPTVVSSSSRAKRVNFVAGVVTPAHRAGYPLL